MSADIYLPLPRHATTPEQVESLVTRERIERGHDIAILFEDNRTLSETFRLELAQYLAGRRVNTVSLRDVAANDPRATALEADLKARGVRTFVR